jgi:hypothetical protein
MRLKSLSKSGRGFGRIENRLREGALAFDGQADDHGLLDRERLDTRGAGGARRIN